MRRKILCKQQILKLLLCCAIMFLTLSRGTFTAFADGNNALVPYVDENGQQVATGDATNNGSLHDYAGEIFSTPELHTDPSVSAAVKSVQNIFSKVLTFIAGIAATLFGAQIVIDMLCLEIKPLTVGLSKLPVQLYSSTVETLTGIAYTGATNGNSGGTAAPAAPTGADGKQLSSKDKLFYYLKERIVLIFFVLLFMTLVYSGVLFKLIYWIINYIVTWIGGIVK